MLQDRFLTPEAKGVLCYLLTLPDTWKIYHSNLMHSLNIGEKYLARILEELIEKGYAMRTRERINGMFGPYHYQFSEFKIFLPDAQKQPADSSLPKADLSITESPKGDSYLSNKQQHQLEEVAAVFSEKDSISDVKEVAPNKFEVQHDLVSSLPLSDSEKKDFLRKYNKIDLEYANSFYNAKIKEVCTFMPDKGWCAYLRAAIKEKWAIPISIEDCVQKNKDYAKSLIEKLQKPNDFKIPIKYEVLNTCVEIVIIGKSQPYVIAYDEKGFKEKLHSAIQKANLIIPKEFL